MTTSSFSILTASLFASRDFTSIDHQERGEGRRGKRGREERGREGRGGREGRRREEGRGRDRREGRREEEKEGERRGEGKRSTSVVKRAQTKDLVTCMMQKVTKLVRNWGILRWSEASKV